MRRRDFIKVVAGSASIWPFTVRAQQAKTPLIGFLSSRSPNESEALVAAFRQGLAETGYAEGQNVHLAFRWAEGRYDRLPELAAELVKSQVAVKPVQARKQGREAEIHIFQMTDKLNCPFFDQAQAQFHYVTL